VTAAPLAQPCDNVAQGVDDGWWPCIRAAGHDGSHWYRDHTAAPLVPIPPDTRRTAP
jgi:hypothetical protein